jgi:ribosomal-protein-alanine N-acetyltransferase
MSMRELILTERLVLRDVSEADAELLFELDSDPEVMRYLGGVPSLDVASYRDRIRTVLVARQSHPWQGIRIVLDRAKHEFLGWAFVRPADQSMFASELGWTRPDEVEIGYRFHRTAWGRGIATEAASPLVQLAFEDARTPAVVACALRANAASLRVLEKLGLQRVGEVMLPTLEGPSVSLRAEKGTG